MATFVPDSQKAAYRASQASASGTSNMVIPPAASQQKPSSIVFNNSANNQSSSPSTYTPVSVSVPSADPMRSPARAMPGEVAVAQNTWQNTNKSTIDKAKDSTIAYKADGSLDAAATVRNIFNDLKSIKTNADKENKANPVVDTQFSETSLGLVRTDNDGKQTLIRDAAGNYVAPIRDVTKDTGHKVSLKESAEAARKAATMGGMETSKIPMSYSQENLADQIKKYQDMTFGQKFVANAGTTMANYALDIGNAALTIPKYFGGEQVYDNSIYALTNFALEGASGNLALNTSNMYETSNWLGKIVLALEQTYAEQKLDLLLGGAGSLVPMGIRVFGGATRQAEQSGKSEGKQIATGLVRTGVEVATEMMGGIGGSYRGTGYGDAIFKNLDRWVANKTNSEFLGTLSSSYTSEMIEEMASDIFNPILDRIFRLSDGDATLLDEIWGDGQILYDGLIGGLSGALGGGGSHIKTSLRVGKQLGTDIATYKAAQRIVESKDARKRFEGYTGVKLDSDDDMAIAQAAVLLTANSNGDTTVREIERDILKGDKEGVTYRNTLGAYLRAVNDANASLYNTVLMNAANSNDENVRAFADGIIRGKYAANNANLGELAIMMEKSGDGSVRDIVQSAAKDLSGAQVMKYVNAAKSKAQQEYETMVAENPGKKVFNPIEQKLHDTTGWSAAKVEQQSGILAKVFSGVQYMTDADYKALDLNNTQVQQIFKEYTGIDISMARDDASRRALLELAADAAVDTERYQQDLRDANEQFVNGRTAEILSPYEAQIKESAKSAYAGTDLAPGRATSKNNNRYVIPPNRVAQTTSAKQANKSTAKRNTSTVAKTSAQAYTGNETITIGKTEFDHDTFIKKYMSSKKGSMADAEAEWARRLNEDRLLYNKPRPASAQNAEANQEKEPEPKKAPSKPQTKATVKEAADNGRTGETVRSDNPVRQSDMADGGSVSEIQSGNAGSQQTADTGRGSTEAAKPAAPASDVRAAEGEVTPEAGYIEESNYSKRQQKFADDLKADGFESVRLAYSELKNDAGQDINAVVRGGDLTIRWSNDADRYADHERIHRWVKAVFGKHPVKRKEFVMRTLRNAVSEDVLTDMYAKYYDEYAKAYSSDVETYTERFGEEQASSYLEGLIYEEILCDMYAGIDYNGTNGSRYTYKIEPLIEMSGIREQALEALGMKDTKVQPSGMTEARMTGTNAAEEEETAMPPEENMSIPEAAPATEEQENISEAVSPITENSEDLSTETEETAASATGEIANEQVAGNLENEDTAIVSEEETSAEQEANQVNQTEETAAPETDNGPTEIDVTKLLGAITSAQQTANETGAEQSVKLSDYAKTSEPQTFTSENGYKVTENTERGSIEISFDGKPDEAIRNVLKANKFRWNSKSKVWYGKADRAKITEALDAAYDKIKPAAATSKEASFTDIFNNATQAEKDEVVQAIQENMGGYSYVYPTEIRDPDLIAAMENEKAAPKYVIPPANNPEANINMEVTNNGESENGSDEGTVQQPELYAEGTSRLLEGVQAEPVQGSSEGRRPSGAGNENRRQDGRGNARSDAEGTDAGRSARDSLGGRVQQLSGVNEEQATDTGTETITPEKQAETLTIEVEDEIDQRSRTSPKGTNFVIGDSLNLPSGTKSRVRANIDAIKLVKKLIAENRYATAEEQEVLSKYVGWGGLADAFGKTSVNYETRRTEYVPVGGLEAEFAELKELLTEEEYKAARESTQNAHYTSIEVVKAMYDGLKHLGFAGGRMLEPSSGTGNFVGAMPADMTSTVKSWTMVELDQITGQIAKYLYPNSDVRIQGFEETNIPDNYMDVAIGNVPFGNYSILDKHYPSTVTNAIHNYFSAKALDKVRPGGICMFITSSFTMGSRDSAVRKYIMERADLIGAIRLPNTAFAGNAGTNVVTDILILKKRHPRTAYSGEAFEQSDWRALDDHYNGAYVNEYFTAHPEMVLGTPNFNGRGLYGRNELTYDPLTDKGSLGDQIREAMNSITGGMDYASQPTPEEANIKAATEKKKKRTLQVDKDGKIIARDESGNTYEIKADTATGKRISGMVEIRDAYNALCDALQQGQSKDTIQQLRKALNKAYDGYVKKNGFLNSAENRSALREFADQYSILSLENYDQKTRKATKTDIFSKDTIRANVTVERAENVSAGLTVSLNTKGSVDVDFIAKLTENSPENVTRQLIDQRLVYKDKDGNLIPAVQYLSGNVRAKLREMEGLVGIDPDYQNNVEALRDVVPETVPYTDIFVNPGANWVPASVYEDFVGFILNRYNHKSYRNGKKDFSVEYVPETNEYKVVINDAYAIRSAENTQIWGEGGKNFSTIFENMLNGRRTNVYVQTEDGRRVLDKTKTEAVAEKVEKLNEEFRKWLWSDETRRDELQELYNETYNALVTPRYDGSGLTVNGLNSTYELRSHQADAVERIISSGGNTLLAHRVGAGKTMEMAAAAMKLKQLGVIKKPMFVVPNNVVAQWGKEFKDYFPAANILVVGDNDMTPAERMTTINKIKNNDYDAVILAYTKFEAIQMTKAWREQFYQEQIDNIIFALNAEKERAGKKTFSVKQLEKKRKQLENKIKKLADTKKDEDGAMFEDLGVDSLFVDEAHNFKNLEYTTRMSNVAGLGGTDGSQRSFDLYTKIRYLQQLNGGRGIVFATATPVMNSMTEMYIMQRYLQPDTLAELGIDNFDSWAKMVGEVVNALEIAPSGSGYRVKQTFSKFKNVHALQQLFRNFTDVVTEIPGLQIPKMKGGAVQIVECLPSDFQKEYMQELAKRAENVKNVDPSEDNMLKITSDGRKISYSQRMIDPTLPYEENGKIFKCCENVYKVYKESSATKGTQMIFCDMATPKGAGKTGKSKTQADTGVEEFGSVDGESAKLYDDIKAQLINLGIPEKEIAFIHDAKNDKQKSALADKMNTGEIRVLIGSTGKMGVGLNAQKKAIAIHHLDAPWRPGDIEQRDGRVFRQKNENPEAYKFVYVTKGSFDSRLWDILERKQKFISQIMNGDNVGNEVEDTGEVTLSAAEVKAVASDNPLILEQVKLEKEISKLESVEKSHQANVNRAKEKRVEDQRKIAEYSKATDDLRRDIAARKDTYSTDEKFSITIGGKVYTKKSEAGVALVNAARENAVENKFTSIGKFAGFDLKVISTKEGIRGVVSGYGEYSFNTYPGNTSYGIAHLISVVEGFEERQKFFSKALAEAKTDLASQTDIINSKFEDVDKLKEKRSRLVEIMDILNPPDEQRINEDSADYDGDSEESFSLADNSYENDPVKRDILNMVQAADNDPEEFARILGEWANMYANSPAPKTEQQTTRHVIPPANAISEKKQKANRNQMDELIDRYGGIDPGENPARDFEAPIRKADGTFVRRFERTAAEASGTPDSMIPQIEQQILSAAGSYVRISDAKAMATADKTFNTYGYEGAKNIWNSTKANPDQNMFPTKEDIALGEKLYIEAANSGDVAQATRTLADLAAMATQAGQIVQAMRMLKMMGPSGQLYYIQKAVDRLNKQFEQRLAKNGQTIEINQDLAEDVLLAGDDAEAMDAAMDALIADIANQVPATLKDKIDAWRYLGMLGNARTHIRNIFGNVVFVPVRFTKDILSAVGERRIDQSQRTKSAEVLLNPGKYKAVREFAAADFDKNQQSISGNGKYNPTNAILQKRKVFKSKALNTLSEKNSDLLEREDARFLRRAYVSAMSQFLVARDVDIENADEKVMNEARQYATLEAQKATYRDASAVASALNRLAQTNKALGFGLDAVLPFKQTPVNILKRGVEYSPVGLIKSATYGLAQVKSGKITAAEFIDNLASGMTGTMVAALGIWLASLGIARGPGDDDKEGYLESTQGQQDYSLVIGDLSFTIDWLAPVSLPFFVGVQAYKLYNESEDLNAWDIYDALSLVAEPMLSLSMLDGINNLIQSAAYSENNAIPTLIGSAATSYASQFIPTILGQFARTFDADRRTNYVDKNKDMPANTQRFIQNLQGKIPSVGLLPALGLKGIGSKEKMAYVDLWGRKDTSSSIVFRAFENFVSPGYINRIKETPVDTELMRLARATGNNDVLPSEAAKQFTIDSKPLNLTADQYEQYAISRGQMAYSLLENLINSSYYEAMGDDLRAKTVKYALDYATSVAKADVIPDYTPSTKWMARANEAGYAEEAIIYQALSNTMDITGNKLVAQMDLIGDEAKGHLILASYSDQNSITDPARKGYKYMLDDTSKAVLRDLYDYYFWPEYYNTVYYDARYAYGDLQARVDILTELGENVRKEARTELARELNAAGFVSEPGEAEIPLISDYLNW